MQRVAICSEAIPAKNGGVYRVLLTVLSNKQPEYMLINLINPPRRDHLEQGKTYRITIEEE
jgi:hypothetical protein